MITIRKSQDRGHARHGWLDSRHTFSFGEYHDPRHTGFRALRVINEDRVLGGGGFPAHSHRDMEILTIVLEGALEHRDSLGNGSVVRPDDVQLMRAGTGVTHSEYNHSAEQVVHLLQIWILPDRDGLAPAYEQRGFPREQKHNKLKVVASSDGRDGSLRLHQDASVLIGVLDAGVTVAYELAAGRHAWVQMARGTASINATPLATGDGAAVSQETRLQVMAGTPAEIVLFDLA